MPKKASAVSVFDYTDYRKYLFDYYQEQKKTSKAFSYRFFARKAAINSIGLYKDVVDGRQSLGRSLIMKFSQAFSHGRREAEYFENMVYFNEAKTVEERKIYFERMMASCQSKAFLVSAKSYEYYSQWYYSAVRALLSCFRLKDDFNRIARLLSPPIRPDQAKKAVKVLETLGFIRCDEKGYYVLDKAVISSGVVSDDQRVNGLNVVNFQKEMMDLAGEAYDRHPYKQLSMSTLTLGISRETFEQVKEDIATLRKKIAHLAENDKNPDRVYQLNYQLFPMSKISDRPEEEGQNA